MVFYGRLCRDGLVCYGHRVSCRICVCGHSRDGHDRHKSHSGFCRVQNFFPSNYDIRMLFGMGWDNNNLRMCLRYRPCRPIAIKLIVM